VPDTNIDRLVVAELKKHSSALHTTLVRRAGVALKRHNGAGVDIPKAKLRALKRKYKELTKGRIFRIPFRKALIAKVKIYLDSDVAEIEASGKEFLQPVSGAKASSAEKNLITLLKDTFFNNDVSLDDFFRELEKSTEYKGFQKEIKTFFDEIDRAEADYDDFRYSRLME
jgi:hypothetical protein